MKKIENFNPKLVDLFRKMILGINVELTEAGKQRTKGILTGRWFFIHSINNDETLTLMSVDQTFLKGVKLSDIKPL